MKTFILALLLAMQFALVSQVSVTTGSYFQDFGTTDILSWTNNSTYQGWYMSGTFQSHISITAAAPSNTGGFYTYECNGNNDQKIGSRASGSTGTIRYGVVLQNNTGAAVNQISVSYKGYQLSLAQNGNTNVIGFDYIVSASLPAITASGGTAVAALNFTQLQSNGASGSAQVMGYPCTQVANMATCINVNIPVGSYILLRWSDPDDSGNDHHMAIDDVDVQFLATNLTAGSATICPSQSATLTVNGATSYTWSPPAGLSTTTGSVVTANPAATTVYTISGSISSCPSKTVTSTVTVNASASVTINSQTICSGSSTILTANGATTYSWTPATGLSSTTGSTVTANPAATTIYTVTGSGICAVLPGTSTVTVLSSPVLAATSQTMCSGTSTTLTANGATTYTWNPSTGLSSANGTVVTANPAATTVYTLTGSNGICNATPLTVTVTVITTPTLAVNSATMCAGGTVTLTATGATNYTWTPATSLSSTNGSIVTANPAGSMIYTVTGNIAGCLGSSATSTVTVFSNPVISVNSQSICPSGTATLTASGAANYTWSPSATLSSATGNVVTATPGTTTIYTVIGISGACPVTPATATVTIVPNPVITVNSSTICSTGTATLTANGATNYSWSPNTGLSSTTGNMVTANPSATTVYTITGNNGACNATPVNATVTVIQLPNLSVSSTSLCASGSVILTVSGAGNYIWAPSASLSSSTGSVVTANPLTTTIFTVTGFINTCSVIATSTLTVVPVNSAAFNYLSSNYCIASAANPLPTITGVTGGTFSALPAGLTINNTTGLVDLISSTQNSYTINYTTGGVCGETQSFVLTINPTPSLSVNSSTICAGENATLIANPSTGGGSFTWLPGNKTGASITTSPAGNTTYTVAYSLNGCAVSETAAITVKAQPTGTITPSSTYVLDGDEVTLTATGGDYYLWNEGSFGSIIKVKPGEITDYCVTVSNNNGCKSSTCIKIDISKESTLYVPNVFTPNGDLLNDQFQIPTTNMIEFNIKIFDRWGALLFESNSVDTSWDGTYKGKEVAADVYVYAITAKGADKVMYDKRGHVTILK